jgi:hypothetical protein
MNNTRYFELLAKDGTHDTDIERKAFFWIIAHNDDLYQKIRHIYDFIERGINPDCLDNGNVDFCSSSKALVKLAFNLYNGYPADVRESFYILDGDNFHIALDAIRMRFNFLDTPEALIKSGMSAATKYMLAKDINTSIITIDPEIEYQVLKDKE